MGDTTAIIRIKHPAQSVIEPIRRVTGFMNARNLIDLIDVLDLEANPRNSRISPITKAIQESIRSDEDAGTKLFPLKSKGILIGASEYEPLERDRFRLHFHDRYVEGILDGGHNTLAIGSFILLEAFRAHDMKLPAQSSYGIWESFKDLWTENRDLIADYLSMIDADPEALRDRGISTLKFSVPVELLVPSSDDLVVIDEFRDSLLEICAARNNNAQLTEGTKANKEGLFGSLSKLLQERDPQLAERVSFKTNDGKPVPVRDIVALAWVPLSKMSWIQGADAIVDAPNPPSIYSGKANALNKYLELMRSDEISIDGAASTREIKDGETVSALTLAADMPALFDRIYQLFPGIYNEAGGKFGGIGAVKSKLNAKGDYRTPFKNEQCAMPVPDGFVYPLVWGLRALIERDEETGKLQWSTDPFAFLESEELRGAARKYSDIIAQLNYDPQKVGKGRFNYTSAEDAIELAAMKYKARH